MSVMKRSDDNDAFYRNFFPGYSRRFVTTNSSELVGWLLVAMGIPFALAGGIYGFWFRDLPFTLPAAVGLITLGGLSLLYE